MKKNMGFTDRIVRTIIAIMIGVLIFTDTITGILGNILSTAGIIFLSTSLVAFCPFYSVLGIRTCHSKKPILKKN